MSINAWMDEDMNVIYTHNEILFNLYKKEILPLATPRINLQDIMPIEISQTQKDKYCMMSRKCGT